MSSLLRRRILRGGGIVPVSVSDETNMMPESLRRLSMSLLDREDVSGDGTFPDCFAVIREGGNTE